MYLTTSKGLWTAPGWVLVVQGIEQKDKCFIDIPAPEPFSGKAEDLRRFIQCILSYFVATNNTRLSDEAKIAFTVALMRKDLGKTWVDAYYEKSAGGVQKNRKTALSLGNYVTCFKQLASKAQLKDAEVNGTNCVENNYHTLHANFVKGLPKELYFALTTRVARDRPNTMKAWYNEVRNADAAKQGALIVTDTRDYGKPMDIDAAAVASTFASTSGGRKWELGAGREPVLLLPHQGPQRQGLPQESGCTTRGWETEPGRIWEG
ncbi:predicted protein [Postia placenta Mad-698-R]|nr:predicted protein [Postia placenta Mad-698-R]